MALAECRNHRKWFADFARPYLGDHPIEIGSGLGDYAREWIPLTEAGLEVIDVRYANSLGLLCYYAFTSLLRKQPSKGVTMTFYDRRLVPVVRFAERLIKSPPFGQSVIAVARVRSPPGAAASALSPEADPETGR